MKASTGPTSALLRGVAMHTQPHTLRRPTREPLRSVVALNEGVHVPRLLPQAPAVPPIDLAYEEARARGLREGREAGLREAAKTAHERLDEALRKAKEEVSAMAAKDAEAQAALLSDRLARIDAFATELDRVVQQHLDRLESDAVALAFEAIAQVLGDSEQRCQIAQALVVKAIARLRTTPIRIRLNGKDLALLDSLSPSEDLRHRHAGIQWLADARVDCGGCLLDTESGTLDARLDTQLTRLLQVWRDVRMVNQHQTVQEAR